MSASSPFARRLTLPGKLRGINWWIVLLILAIGGLGVAMLYSVAGGSWTPWALNQAIRFSLLACIMLAMATVDLEVWLRIAYPAYGVVLLLLVGVEIVGQLGGGAQRWIDLGVIAIQPSEFMKLALVLALARYFHELPRVLVSDLPRLGPAAALILVPACLVLLQPNLGTASLIILAGAGIIFLAGAPPWLFWTAGGAGLASLPIIWGLMHDYQKRRVLTFLDPSADPLGSGYNITQSMIAIGSGGLFGKGFLNGTQGALDFLPEHHTDFIFSAIMEELGLMGGVALLASYIALISWAFWVALTARSQFGRLVAAGMAINLFLYIAINMSMVMGLAPVVGIPLPLISYGGSAMMTVLFALGIVFSVSIQRDLTLGRDPDEG
jgi:rod shape determining protein RodA